MRLNGLDNDISLSKMLYCRNKDPEMNQRPAFSFLILILLLMAPRLGGQMLADFESPASVPGLSADGGFAVVANPDKTGINTSDSVVTYHKPEGNWKWLRLHFPDTVKIRYNNTLTFKLRATARGRIFAKFYHGSVVVIENWCPSWNFQPAPNTWVECTMDLTAAMGKRFTRLDLAACVDNNEPADVWFDDIRLSNPEAGDGTPVLDFSLSHLKLVTGDELTCNAVESYDFDGEVVRYHWDFGNGDTLNGPLVQYSYPSGGIFTLTAAVSDNEGKTAWGTERIFVIDPADGTGEPWFVTSNPQTNKKIEAIFHTRENYIHPFDPDEVKVDAVVTLPEGDSMVVPCFYYVPAGYDGAGWVADPVHGSWMVRFMSPRPGLHEIRFRLTDDSGTWWSDRYPVTVHPGDTRGVIREDPRNRQYFRHSTGEPFYPAGINVAWNSMENYATILKNLAGGRANVFRYWHTPFAKQALEWSEDYYYNYGGLGIYNQEAAAMSDSLLDLCDSLDMYMQLCIFQHGQFSENVDQMWESNPYNTVNGGYVERAEEYFYSQECRDQARKLLRYLVARWSYSRNLFAWEFFNE
ncbi:MAG: PKD domain-containing protein, partial [Bacteroidetes bacterium]